MQNRSPIFYGIVAGVSVIALIFVVLIIQDAFYVGRLFALESNGKTATGKLLVPDYYVGSGEVRTTTYIFDVDGVQYQGEAQENGLSTNQIGVRYLAGNPAVNMPADLDIPTEKGFALLRIVAILGFSGVGVIAVLLLRRR